MPNELEQLARSKQTAVKTIFAAMQILRRNFLNLFFYQKKINCYHLLHVFMNKIGFISIS